MELHKAASFVTVAIITVSLSGVHGMNSDKPVDSSALQMTANFTASAVKEDGCPEFFRAYCGLNAHTG